MSAHELEPELKLEPAEKISEERLDRWVTAALEFIGFDPEDVPHDSYLRTMIRGRTCHWGIDYGEYEDTRLPLCTEEDTYPADSRAYLRERHRAEDCQLTAWKQVMDRIRQLYAFAGVEYNTERVIALFDMAAEHDGLKGVPGMGLIVPSNHAVADDLFHLLGLDQPRTDMVRTLVGDFLEITYTPKYGRDVLLDHLRHVADPSLPVPSSAIRLDPDRDLLSPDHYVLCLRADSDPDPDSEQTPALMLCLPFVDPALYVLQPYGISFETIRYTLDDESEKEIKHTLCVKFAVAPQHIADHPTGRRRHWTYDHRTLFFYYFPCLEDVGDQWLIVHHDVLCTPWHSIDLEQETRLLHRGSLEAFEDGLHLPVLENPCLDYTRADLRSEWVARLRCLLQAYLFE